MMAVLRSLWQTPSRSEWPCVLKGAAQVAAQGLHLAHVFMPYHVDLSPLGWLSWMCRVRSGRVVGGRAGGRREHAMSCRARAILDMPFSLADAKHV